MLRLRFILRGNEWWKENSHNKRKKPFLVSICCALCVPYSWSVQGGIERLSESLWRSLIADHWADRLPRCMLLRRRNRELSQLDRDLLEQELASLWLFTLIQSLPAAEMQLSVDARFPLDGMPLSVAYLWSIDDPSSVEVTLPVLISTRRIRYETDWALYYIRESLLSISWILDIVELVLE